jgi:hypothetical protein
VNKRRVYSAEQLRHYGLSTDLLNLEPPESYKRRLSMRHSTTMILSSVINGYGPGRLAKLVEYL